MQRLGLTCATGAGYDDGAGSASLLGLLEEFPGLGDFLRDMGLEGNPNVMIFNGDRAVEELLAGKGKGEGKGSACRFCRSPLGATPAAQTDLYSIGHLDVQRDALTFRLLRAPDGAVLDEVTVVHKSKM